MKRSAGLLFLLASTLLALAQTAAEVEITAEPHHHLVLQNKYVRVFKVEVDPKGATLMHFHRHDYVYVNLGAGEISNEVQGKPPARIKLQDGEVQFSAGNFAHLVRDLAATPFRNLTIEFMQDEQAHRTPPPKWDEERGLDILSGGTREILFVKDGIRVAETELQPGAVIPKHHHAGPHLVVAVTDFDLRSDEVGKGPSEIVLKSGEVRWFPGGYTHTVTNAGNSAKFVTLEFH